MTTIERLEERIAHSRTRASGRRPVAKDLRVIMQALVELLEKADQPVTFDIPTTHPDIVQHVVATPEEPSP